MKLTYLDQNGLIELGRKARHAEARRRLDSMIESGTVIFVVSLWHLVETAHTANLSSALELARFIDSLRPHWLLERRKIQELEVQEDFFRYINVPHTTRPRVTTRSAVVATLNGERDGAQFAIPSDDFVRRWVVQPELLSTFEGSCNKSTYALIRLRELAKAGKIGEKLRSEVSRILVKLSIPRTTPAGLEIGNDLKVDYVSHANIQDLPTFAVEAAISEEEWLAEGGADRNTLLDKLHLISALPYVDEMVSNDGFFWKIYPAARRSNHVRARLVGNEEFLCTIWSNTATMGVGCKDRPQPL
jgi:hypothetical protein